VGLLVAAGTAAVSQSAGAAPALAGASVAAKASVLVAAKWLGIGLLGTLLSLGAVELALNPSPTSAPARTVVAPLAAAEVAVRDGAVLPAASAARPEAAPERRRSPHSAPATPAVVPQPALEPAPATAVFEPSSTHVDGLAQLAELAVVRHALANREPQRALALLGEFDARHPASRLAEEALVLRVEALQGAGRGAEGRALGSRFLREHPASVYVARVQRALEIP
jgi:hypothetical protein